MRRHRFVPVAGLALVESHPPNTDDPEQRSGQQLRRDCRSACSEDRAFEDDGEATIWFYPLDRLSKS